LRGGVLGVLGGLRCLCLRLGLRLGLLGLRLRRRLGLRGGGGRRFDLRPGVFGLPPCLLGLRTGVFGLLRLRLGLLGGLRLLLLGGRRGVGLGRGCGDRLGRCGRGVARTGGVRDLHLVERRRDEIVLVPRLRDRGRGRRFLGRRAGRLGGRRGGRLGGRFGGRRGERGLRGGRGGLRLVGLRRTLRLGGRCFT